MTIIQVVIQDLGVGIMLRAEQSGRSQSQGELDLAKRIMDAIGQVGKTNPATEEIFSQKFDRDVTPSVPSTPPQE